MNQRSATAETVDDTSRHLDWWLTQGPERSMFAARNSTKKRLHLVMLFYVFLLNWNMFLQIPTHEAMFGAPCPGRRLSSADCLLQRKLFNVTKKVRESRWMIQMWSRWIACELVYSKGMRKLGRNVIWEEKKSIYGIDGVCVFFGRLIRCLIRIRNEFSKMLQLLFRQAVDFDGFSVAPLSFASLASRLNSCRRLGGGVAFWSLGNATFFAVCFNCQVDSSLWLSTEHEEFPSFVQLELQKKVRMEKCRND